MPEKRVQKEHLLESIAVTLSSGGDDSIEVIETDNAPEPIAVTQIRATEQPDEVKPTTAVDVVTQPKAQKPRSISSARAKSKRQQATTDNTDAASPIPRRLSRDEAYKLARSRGYAGAVTSMNRDFREGRLERVGIGMVDGADRVSGWRGGSNYIDLHQTSDRADS